MYLQHPHFNAKRGKIRLVCVGNVIFLCKDKNIFRNICFSACLYDILCCSLSDYMKILFTECLLLDRNVQKKVYLAWGQVTFLIFPNYPSKCLSVCWCGARMITSIISIAYTWKLILPLFSKISVKELRSWSWWFLSLIGLKNRKQLPH